MNLKPRVSSNFCAALIAEIAFADKIGEAEPLVLILFCHRYNEAEVGTNELVESLESPW